MNKLPRVILVGHSNPYTDDLIKGALHYRPVGATGYRLLQLMQGAIPGFTKDDYRYKTIRRNLLHKDENERRDTLLHARGRLIDELALSGQLTDQSRLVCLGAVVRNALVGTVSWNKWSSRFIDEIKAEIAVTAIPNPSGLNRYYNNPGRVRMVHRVLREALA